MSCLLTLCYLGQIGAVIGKAGHSVKAIQSLSGARIVVDNAEVDIASKAASPQASVPPVVVGGEAMPPRTSRTVEISGTAQQIYLARIMIDRCMKPREEQFAATREELDYGSAELYLLSFR